MKHLVGKQQTKKVAFAGDEVEVRKLSISQVKSIQDILNDKKKSKDEMLVLREVLRLAVIGAEEMTDEDFDTFAPADLAELSEEIMQYCGLGEKAQSGNLVKES